LKALNILAYHATQIFILHFVSTLFLIWSHMRLQDDDGGGGGGCNDDDNDYDVR
jgi:hypothetical protein